MDNLEKKLNNLPRARLRRRADLKIRFRLYAAILKKRLAPEKMRFSWNFRALAGSVLLLILIVVPGYAYAGTNVVPGDFLYPLKMKLEEIELSLARKKNKAEIYAELSAKRLAEAKVLATTIDKPKTEEKIKINLDKALLLRERAISGFSNSGSTTLRIKALNSQEEAMLTDIAQSAGVGAEDDLIDSIALALDKVKGRDKDREGAEKRGRLDKSNEPEKAGTEVEGRETFFLEEKKDPEVCEDCDRDRKADEKSLISDFAPLTTGTTTKRDDNITDLRDNIDRLTKDLKKPEFEQQDVENLINKINNKVKRAEEIRGSDQEGAKNLLRSAEALTDNAEHFIRKKDKNDDRRKEERREKEK